MASWVWCEWGFISILYFVIIVQRLAPAATHVLACTPNIVESLDYMCCNVYSTENDSILCAKLVFAYNISLVPQYCYTLTTDLVRHVLLITPLAQSWPRDGVISQTSP